MTIVYNIDDTGFSTTVGTVTIQVVPAGQVVVKTEDTDAEGNQIIDMKDFFYCVEAFLPEFERRYGRP